MSAWLEIVVVGAIIGALVMHAVTLVSVNRLSEQVEQLISQLNALLARRAMKDDEDAPTVPQPHLELLTTDAGSDSGGSPSLRDAARALMPDRLRAIHQLTDGEHFRGGAPRHD